MNYNHSYHAGNFADVIKHIMLIELLFFFEKKPAAFCYIDTHAGASHYDLTSVFANKSKEYLQGIEKIIQQENPPPAIKNYLHCIHQLNNKLTQTKYSSLRYYPGSVMIARYFLRPQDRIIACELQSQAYQILKNTFLNDRQIATHHLDGFLGLKAFIPPREHRGIVLIDPPYEDPDEFNHLAQSLPPLLKRWRNGLMVIWYPIKNKFQIERFHRQLKHNLQQPVFIIELTIHQDLAQHLNGCGLAIINLPWKFDQNIGKILPWLWNALTINKQGAYQAYFLR